MHALQFELHELLAHALQAANISARCAQEDVPWVRIFCVHSNQQVLFEGLAQALPLYVAPDDELLAARTRLDHYHELVRAELHLAIDAGVPIEDCARHAKARVPYWRNETIADYLSDRGANPLLRSYLWAYPQPGSTGSSLRRSRQQGPPEQSCKRRTERHSPRQS